MSIPLVATLWIAAFARGRPAPPPRNARPIRASTLLLPDLDRLFAAVARLTLLIGFMMPMFEGTLVYFVTYALDRPSRTRRRRCCLWRPCPPRGAADKFVQLS